MLQKSGCRLKNLAKKSVAEAVTRSTFAASRRSDMLNVPVLKGPHVLVYVLDSSNQHLPHRKSSSKAYLSVKRLCERAFVEDARGNPRDDRRINGIPAVVLGHLLFCRNYQMAHRRGLDARGSKANVADEGVDDAVVRRCLIVWED